MTKIKRNLILTFVLLITCIAFYFSAFYHIIPSPSPNHRDVSMEAPYKSKYPHNIWLISFADDGIHQANQNYLNFHSINKGFDFILSYNKKHIDQEYYKKHENILSQKRGAGYWLWKPYLIRKTLDLMNDGDILFYIDSGTLINDNVDFFIDKMNETKNDMILLENFHINKYLTKKDCYLLMDVDEKYIEYYQLDASIIIIRKSAHSISFIDKWLAYCENEQLITDSRSEKEFEGFIDHRHDQSILTLLYYKYPNNILLLDKKDPEIESKFSQHRRRDFSYSLGGQVLNILFIKKNYNQRYGKSLLKYSNRN